MHLFFRKNQRVVRQREFRSLFAHKCFAQKGFMRLYTAPNAVGCPRFGISVSRKCGNAVRRNRLKRLAREVFRLHQHDLPGGRDYLLILAASKPINKKNQTAMDYRTFEGLFLSLVESVSKNPCFDR